MTTNDLLSRVDFLISKGKSALTTEYQASFRSYVERSFYAGFRSASLSFILNLCGKDHTYYKEFDSIVNDTDVTYIQGGISILESLKDEIEQGWLISFKQLITAEVFSDFLEMSKHLLDQNYKDPAAVMIGSVLEEHLRQLCANHFLDVNFLKGNDVVPKKADFLNADLVKAGVYGVLQQKNVTAWLGLRNSAAHGKYSEYTIEEVRTMYLGVLDFVTRIS